MTRTDVSQIAAVKEQKQEKKTLKNTDQQPKVTEEQTVMEMKQNQA